jgi:hypothetical protein
MGDDKIANPLGRLIRFLDQLKEHHTPLRLKARP